MSIFSYTSSLNVWSSLTFLNQATRMWLWYFYRAPFTRTSVFKFIFYSIKIWSLHVSRWCTWSLLFEYVLIILFWHFNWHNTCFSHSEWFWIKKSEKIFSSVLNVTKRTPFVRQPSVNSIKCHFGIRLETGTDNSQLDRDWLKVIAWREELLWLMYLVGDLSD